MKKQIVVIHGGDNFKTYAEYLNFLKTFKLKLKDLTRVSWKDSLQQKLGKNYEVIQPEMPNGWNARYKEWKIWFDKILPLLNRNLILVGNSLGGIFLTKYLSENKLKKKINAVFLVAAPFDEKDADYNLLDFKLPKSLKLLEKQGGKLFFYHSKDDDQVPFKDLEKYRRALPSAIARVFEDRGHFNQTEFKELVDDIKSIK